MHNLGVLAARGLGKRPDYAKAAVWFEKAAEFNIRDSQFNQAILLARGFGVPRDEARSYVWFGIAAANGDADASRGRDEMARKLSAGDLAAAKADAEAFRLRPLDETVNEAVS